MCIPIFISSVMPNHGCIPRELISYRSGCSKSIIITTPKSSRTAVSYLRSILQAPAPTTPPHPPIPIQGENKLQTSSARVPQAVTSHNSQRQLSNQVHHAKIATLSVVANLRIVGVSVGEHDASDEPNGSGGGGGAGVEEAGDGGEDDELGDVLEEVGVGTLGAVKLL